MKKNKAILVKPRIYVNVTNLRPEEYARAIECEKSRIEEEFNVFYDLKDVEILTLEDKEVRQYVDVSGVSADDIQSYVEKANQKYDYPEIGEVYAVRKPVNKSKIAQDKIDIWFTYHPPTEKQQTSYIEIRKAAKTFAMILQEHVPESRDKQAAFRKLRECVMTSNAGIACHEE